MNKRNQAILDELKAVLEEDKKAGHTLNIAWIYGCMNSYLTAQEGGKKVTQRQRDNNPYDLTTKMGKR